MSTTTIDDLPNEILDEILQYINPEIRHTPIRMYNTVCRRWNRPMMTQKLDNPRLPVDIDIQSKFPKLVKLKFKGDRDEPNHFKGHGCVKKLSWCYPRSLLPALNCPRLTNLFMETHMDLYFEDDNLAALLTLCPSLTHLCMRVFSEEDPNTELLDSYNGKLTAILEKRDPDYPGLKNLKDLAIITEALDALSFCAVFKAPLLEDLAVSPLPFQSIEQVRFFFSLFPKLRTMVLPSSSLVENYHEAIHKTVTDATFYNYDVQVRLSQVLHQFPNLEHLNSEMLSVIDVSSPTLITSLVVTSLQHQIWPDMFPNLKSLDWIGCSIDLYTLLSGLGDHCPQMENISLRQTTTLDEDHFVPILSHSLLFPLLKELTLDGLFKFNASFTQFIARHSTLETLFLANGRNHEVVFEVIESQDPIWPKLQELTLYVNRESVFPHLHYFLKNSPNLTKLTFGMGDYESTDRELDIIRYCPRLKSLNYSGYLSSESLKTWMRSESWAHTVRRLTLAIMFQPMDLSLVFKFLKSLTRLEILSLYIVQPCFETPLVVPTHDIYQKYVDPCPDEWKSIATEYCDALSQWLKLFPTLENNDTRPYQESPEPCLKMFLNPSIHQFAYFKPRNFSIQWRPITRNVIDRNR